MAIGLVPIVPLQASKPGLQHVMDGSNALLANTITNASHDFLRASPSLHEAALLAAKHYLDPLAASISHTQIARLQEARRKRKRGDAGVDESVLRLKQLYVEDFSTEQIWEQSRRILDASAKEVQLVLDSDPISANGIASTQKSVRFADADLTSERLPEDESEADTELDDSENGEDEEQAVNGNGSLDELDDHDIGNVSDIEDEGSSLLEDDNDEQVPRSTFTKDKHGLNDGFFSIDDFNRTSELLEQVDARGDPNDGAASDEEDVDWGVDPMSQSLPNTMQKQQNAVKSRTSGDGPTFGDADLNAPWSDDESNENDEGDIEMDDNMDENTNEIYYKDFFAPPPRALTKTKRMRALPKTQPAEPEDEDIQRTISAVHRDIFSDDDIEGSDLSDDQDNRHLSTHERRQKALAEQIRKLEAEAIAKREWTMIGEARAFDRPVNSLLEDDLVLDFERAGKPVPEATAAVTEAIEDLVKSRILARNFDEIPKRRAGLDTNLSAQGKRGLIELDDRKNPQSLAEIYETEHLKATDPNYIDSRDAETKKAHQEIEVLWKSVAAKLDALCSWHYKPKPADMEIRVLSDTPRVQMEDARPAGVGIGAEESGLAPQEVYRVGEELSGKKGDANIVLTTGGAIAARDELTREQKLRRRRREKERIKKKGSSNTPPAPQAASSDDVPIKRVKKVAEKKNILEELRRGNVKVIGKGGAIQDVEGRKAQAGSSTEVRAGTLKL